MDVVGKRSATVLIGAALVVAVALPAQAATPSVVGKVTGKLPPGATASTSVRAYDVATSAVAAATRVGRAKTFRLSLPPGAYVLETTITPGHGRPSAAVQGFTALSLATGQRRGAVKIAKPTAAKLRRASLPRGQAAWSQASGAIQPGTIAVSIEPLTGGSGEYLVLNRGLADMLITDLAEHTPCRTTVVANSSDLGKLAGEWALSKSIYIDPATKITPNRILPDIIVRGRFDSAGKGLGYTLTLNDGRTGEVLQSITGTIAPDQFFEAEPGIAARLAKAICGYGEVFQVDFAGSGVANFALYTATGDLSAAAITAKPTENDGQGATKWEGSGSMSWINEVVTSKTPGCAYVDPTSGGTWTATLVRVGDNLQVQWRADAPSSVMVTAACPDGSGGEERIPGLPATALLDSQPNNFLLPADGSEKVSGPGVDDQGYGWQNTLELKVHTIRVEPLG